jgi:hypothetical protein
MVQINWGGGGWRNVEYRGKVRKRNLFTVMKSEMEGRGRKRKEEEGNGRKWKEEEGNGRKRNIEKGRKGNGSKGNKE